MTDPANTDRDPLQGFSPDQIVIGPAGETLADAAGNNQHEGTMICFSTTFLHRIGFTKTDTRVMYLNGNDEGGLSISPLASFGGGGNQGRDKQALERTAAPKRLLLVGMQDRYGVAAGMGATVTEVCPEGVPTLAELEAICLELDNCQNPLAVDIAARLRKHAGVVQ